MGKFYWDDLLDALVQGRSVVPVVGGGLTLVRDGEVAVPFHEGVARRCLGWLQEHYDLQLPEGSTIAQLRAATRRAGYDFTPAFYAAHQEALRVLADGDLPEPLRLLAEMDAFPFILTTTTSALVARALRIEPRDVASIKLGLLADLPLGWQPGQSPRLFHLFGRVEPGSEGVVSDEDLVEHVAHLHDKGRPVRLLSHLRQSHLLFLGNEFPDWLARVFLRLLRDDRFEGGHRAAFDAVADREARDAGSLTGFLRAHSPKTRVYEEGSAVEFVRSLHAGWHERLGEMKPTERSDRASSFSQPESIEPELEPMREPAIFVSYASENRSAAEALAAALSSAQLPVWLDRRELQGGEAYAGKIEENIRRCRLFIPLMSQQSAQRQEGWFRREWLRARERLESVGPDLTFVVPVIIDQSDPYAGNDLRRYFSLPGHEPHVLFCQHGVPTSEQLHEFVRKFRASTRAAAER